MRLQASYQLGLALRHQLRHGESVIALERALDAARASGDSIKDEIWRELAACKLAQWEQASTVRRDKRERLQARLADMIELYYKQNKTVCASLVLDCWALPPPTFPLLLPQASARSRLQAKVHGAGSQAVETDARRAKRSSTAPQAYKAGLQDTSRRRDEADLAEIFRIAAARDAGGEADGAYTCTLTMEPFRDPVCTPDGNSYERAALLDHLRKVGAFDPVSRSPLSVQQLVPNYKLRVATQQYLDTHEWCV